MSLEPFIKVSSSLDEPDPAADQRLLISTNRKRLRLGFIFLFVILTTIGTLFSKAPVETLGYLRWIEAVLWLVCGLLAPLVVYLDPSKWIKGLACLCILLFTVEYLGILAR